MRKTEVRSGETVDGYIAQFPPDVQKALQNLRKIIQAAAPKAEERIGWRMPGYKYHGWLVFFAGFKKHMSLFVASTQLMKTLKKDLKSYETSGATVHFTTDRPLPVALVRKIVKLRMKENENRAKTRKG